uniref:DNA-directed DNA polymerase n=1 Tax=Trypanosoma congolense (strain IL3000) TaxID=1068625 RepID=F9W777_TRYCI|nr:unnamed protein product [Trypanosoma congolense IL3000]
MPLYSHLYQRYVPVELTHIPRGGEEKADTGHYAQCSSNELKWREFGLKTHIPEKPQFSHVSNAAVAAPPSTESRKTGAVDGQFSLCEQLMRLTSRVGQAREQIANAARVKDRTHTKEASTTHTSSETSASASVTTGDAPSLSRKRGRVSNAVVPQNSTVSNSIVTHDINTTEKEKRVTLPSEPKQVQKGKDDQQDRTPQKKTKARGGGKTCAPTETQRRSGRAAVQRTLFSMPACQVTAIPRSAQVSFKEADNCEALFEDIRGVLNDPNRYQVPIIFVAFITREGETNFTISAASRGKVHFIRGANPELSHLEVALFVIRWKDDVTVFPGGVGLNFLVRVIVELAGVEIVTFNAPAVLLPLLSYKQGQLFTTCVSDVRLMAWMLEPSAETETFTDYDTLLQMHQQQVGLPVCLGDLGDRSSKEAVSYRVFYMAALYRVLYGKLGSHGLLPAFLKQEKRISIMCAAMKLNGFHINLEEVDNFKSRCTSTMDKLRAAAKSKVPSMKDFNIQSSDDCRIALYEVLHLGQHLVSRGANGTLDGSSLTVTKCGKLSTSEESLRLLAPYHELPRIIMAYRRAAKILQTYIVGFMEMAILTEGSDAEFVDRRIGEAVQQPVAVNLHKTKHAKIFPNFVQEGTETGRLTCVEPNMQSLPRAAVVASADEETDSDGKNGSNEGNNNQGICDGDADEDHCITDENSDRGSFCVNSPAKDVVSIRRCFTVPEGFSLVSLDYEQIELRVLAHLSEDPALINILTNSGDIHSTIAKTVFRKSDVTPEERNLAKRVVFGILYGAGPRLLAQQMGVSIEKALRISSLFKSSFPRVDSYQREVIEQCRTDGFVRTLSGRIRHIPDINDRMLTKRSHAERQAFNTVVQGSAADVMKLGMIAVERDVLQQHAPHVRMILQVHDEIVLSLPSSLLPKMVPIIVQSFTHPISMLVPLRVTTKVGRMLGEMEEWTVEHEFGLRVPS